MSKQLVTDENPDEILSHVIHIEDYIASLEEALAVCHNTYNWQLMNATTDEESDKIKTVYTAHTTRVETRINEKVNIDIVVKKMLDSHHRQHFILHHRDFFLTSLIMNQMTIVFF